MSEGHPNRPTIDVVKRGKRPSEEFDPAKLHHSILATCLSIRTDKAGNVHVPIGKASFDADKLRENYQAIIDTLIRVKPAAAKGQYIRSITVVATMGPAVPVALS